MKVIGFAERAFTPKDAKDEIRGVTIYYTYDDKKITGMACDRVFVSENKLGSYKPKLGDMINIVYNRYGKVDRVELA